MINYLNPKVLVSAKQKLLSKYTSYILLGESEKLEKEIKQNLKKIGWGI